MLQSSWVPPIASRQFGVFTKRQAVAAGASEGQVRWRLRSGVWIPVVGSALRHAEWRVDETMSQISAAHLTWPDATVAYRTAARVHGLPVAQDGRVHVVVPGGRRARGRLTPYQFRLDDGDVCYVNGVPVTSRRRTVLDCLGRLPKDEASSLLAWVSSRRILAPEAIQTWLGAHRGRLGNLARAQAAQRLAAGAVSPAEDLLHEILRRAGITGWIAGAWLAEHVGVYAQADVYFPAVRLVIEVDGRSAHGGEAFQRDRTRQNELVAAGCVVLRYTWHDLVERPGMVGSQISTMLAALRGQCS